MGDAMKFTFDQATAFWNALVGWESIGNGGEDCGSPCSPHALTAIQFHMGFTSTPRPNDFARTIQVLNSTRNPYPHEKQNIEAVAKAGEFLIELGQAMRQASIDALNNEVRQQPEQACS